jgi:CheY-like chemotaxis protein
MPATDPLRIIYVEDNDDVRDITGVLLSGPGREVTALASGEEALDLIARQHCDVLFTDFNLPGMSGGELAKRLLARDPEHWVVLCTGWPLEQKVERWGPRVRVLSKVFKLDELEGLLADITTDVRARRTAGGRGLEAR